MDALDVRARGAADLVPPGGPHRHELGEAVTEGLRRRVDERDRQPERVLGPARRLVVQERDDRLAERHALDREQPVPTGVQLVDDDVGVAIARERLVVVKALDDPELDVEALARAEHVVGSLAAARGRCVDDHGAPAAGGGRRRHRGQVDPRRDHGRLRHPADRVVAADDLGARLLAVPELLRRLSTDVRAEVVHHRALAERTEDRELERLRNERQPEREVEEVGRGEQLRERLPLRELPPDEAALEVERAVGLGVERVPVEDDELRVDPASAQGLYVRPRDARGVDGAVDDAERSVHVGEPRGSSMGEPLVPPCAPSSRKKGARGGNMVSPRENRRFPHEPPPPRLRHSEPGVDLPGGKAGLRPRHESDPHRENLPAAERAGSHDVPRAPSPIRAGRSSGARSVRGGSAGGGPRARRRRSRRARASRRGTGG